MGFESHALSSERPRARLGRFLRARLDGPFRTKRLAVIAQCSAKTAENMLLDHWPSDLHLAAIVAHFGKDLLDAVFRPDIDATLVRLQQEERRLAQALQATRLRLEAEGYRAGDPEHVEADQAEVHAQLDLFDVGEVRRDG